MPPFLPTLVAAYFALVYSEEFSFSYTSGGFPYATEFGQYTLKCHYDDSYFKTPSTTYFPQLSTASLCLALSAFNRYQGDYTVASNNVKELMTKFGVSADTFETNTAFKEKPGTDTIGVAVGYKTLTISEQKYTLLIVSLRGGAYEKEWSGNLNLGKEGPHEGFEIARKEVLTFLQKYVADHRGSFESQSLKLWITGFSRSAAIANLVAASLDDDLTIFAPCTLSQTSIYAYTMNTPAGAYLPDGQNPDGRYSNIFNFINPYDFIPRIAPRRYAFSRYGIDKFLPSLETSVLYEQRKEAVTSQFSSIEALDGFTYGLDDISFSTLAPYPPPTLSLFLNDVMEVVFSVCPTRESYASEIQPALQRLVEHLMDGTNFEDVMTKITPIFLEIVALVSSDISLIFEPETLFQQILPKLSALVDYDKATDDFTTVFNKVLMPMANADVFTLLILLSNAKTIATAHMPELLYAWLTLNDPTYSGDNVQDIFGSDVYRIIESSSPVDIVVSDGTAASSLTRLHSNALVCSTNKNEGQEQGTSPSLCTTRDGYRFVYLPSDSTFTASVSISADEDEEDLPTLFGLQILEYSYARSMVFRTVNYEYTPASKESVFTATLPPTASDDDDDLKSTTQYTLSDSTSTVTPTVDSYTTDPMLYPCSLDVTSDYYGSATTNGKVECGYVVTLEAIPLFRVPFTGWYENDKLVATDLVYPFYLTGNHTFQAKFELYIPPPADSKSLTTGGIVVIVIIASIFFILLVILIIELVLCLRRGRADKEESDNCQKSPSELTETGESTSSASV